MDKSKESAVYEKRKNAVAAVQQGEAVTLIARTHGVPLRTIFTWLSWYQGGGWVRCALSRVTDALRLFNSGVLSWLYQAVTLGNPRQYQLPFCL